MTKYKLIKQLGLEILNADTSLPLVRAKDLYDLLEKATVVYGIKKCWGTEKDPGDEYQALLLPPQPIEKKCEHKSIESDNGFTGRCNDCGASLKSVPKKMVVYEWREVEG